MTTKQVKYRAVNAAERKVQLDAETAGEYRVSLRASALGGVSGRAILAVVLSTAASAGATAVATGTLAATVTAGAIALAAGVAVVSWTKAVARVRSTAETHAAVPPELTAWMDRLDQRIDSIAEEQARSAGSGSGRRLSRPNTARSWTNLAPGSRYDALAPQARGDVKVEVRQDGSHCYRADVDRVREAYLRRFTGKTKLGAVRVVIYGVSKRRRTPPTVATQLAVYRAVAAVAREAGEDADFRCLRFYLLEEPAPPASLFVVDKVDESGLPVGCVVEYRDRYALFGITYAPETDLVEFDFSEDAAKAGRRIVDDLVRDVRPLTYEELEDRFGASVASVPPRPSRRPQLVASESEPIVIDSHFRL